MLTPEAVKEVRPLIFVCFDCFANFAKVDDIEALRP